MSITQPLEGAIDIVRDRAQQHGDHVALHQRIADLWSVYLGIRIEPHQVAMMQAQQKVARSEFDPSNEDNPLDFLGYGNIWADLLKIGLHRARERGVKENL